MTLPPDATLTIDGRPTTSASGTRVFITPDLPPDREFSYTLKAEVLKDGERQVITREVAVRAGEESRITLDIPATALAAE